MDVNNTRIERVAEALGRASCQEFDHRLEISETEDEFMQVEVGVNLLLEDLGRARDENKRQLAEIERKNQEIAEQQSLALRELSTPIISVWDGVLTLPVVGMVDTHRGAEMMDRLLTRVVDDEAAYVVIDITGVNVVDTRTADHFIRMSEAVRLLGSTCFLTGISPAVAQTIAQLGIDTSRIRTLRRLSDALRQIFEEMGDKAPLNAATAGSAR